MRFLNKVTILFLSIICISKLNAQPSKEIVAKAGQISITKEEFQKRYEFIPHIKTDEGFDSLSLKKNFLQTIIAEKLLAQEAAKEGIDQQRNYKSIIENISNVYLRDVLYKKEILDNIQIPDSELMKGKLRMLKSFRTKFIFSTDQEEIETLFSIIKNGGSFDSLLSTRKENLEQKEEAKVTFGSMNEKMEDAIYITGIGQTTPPIELKEGWYICKVYSIDSKMDLEPGDKSKTEKVVKTRIEEKTFQSFYKDFFKGIIVTADRPKVEKLFNAFMNYLNENKNNLTKNKAGKFRIGEADVPILRKSFNESELNEVIIKFQKDPVTLSRFFDYLSFQDFELYNTDSVHIKSRLNSYISFYIQNEILSREAKKRGYDKLPEFVSELKMWKDYYLAHEMMKKSFRNLTVTDDEAYKFFVKVNQVIQLPNEYKIAQIVTSDLNTVEIVFNELDKGKNFLELAKKYETGSSSKFADGVSGFFKADEKSEIGKAVVQMKIGEVFGPIYTKEGYTIIKLLEKKEGIKEKVGAFENAKEDIKNILKTEKMNKNLEDATAKLAMKLGVEINNSTFNTLKVSQVNMIVLRRFGFGGQLLAVPFTPNFSAWFKKYEQLKKKNIF